MSSGIDCGKLEEVLESIFQIPVDAAKLDKWVNGGEFETVILGGKEVPTLRNLVRQIDERSSQAAEEEINEAKKEIGALAEKLKAKIEELKALTASAETLPPDHPATAYYNSGTGEIEFGIPQGKQGIQGERGLAPAIDIIYGGDPSDEALSIIYGGNPALDEPGDRTIIRQVARIGTSAQWATANPILEDGESGYERTPEDKLLWKTGDGVTYWNDLPYPSILVDKIYRYRGSVATVEELPTDAAEGDVYNITSTGANYAWTGTEWDNLGVAGAIDPVPVKDSGNPVASGGVYVALEDMQTDIAATGAPDDVTIIKDESGKLVAQDIAIGGDPTDLASARGYIVDELLPWYPGYFDTPLADFDAATILGRYHVAVHKETTLNAPPILLFTTGTTSNDGMLMVEAMSSATGISSVVRYRQTFMVFGAASKIWVRHQGTSGEWQAWREIIADTNIGDGIRVTGGILSVPEYEGATATEPGTAGLVNPAASAEKDYVYHGDGTWRENTNVKVDGTTIAKDGSDVISVIPGGIIDNDTIVLDASGKISTKSVLFDKPSDNRWHQSHFIFSAVANTAVPVNATNLVNYDTSANNSVLFEPNSSGQLICRKTGLYGVRVEFSTYYVGDGSTAMDGWFYIKLNNIDIGSSGTPLLAAANEPNVFTCYVNRRIEAGQVISTAWNIPYTGNVQVNYIDYQFTYFPVTNEYQVRNPSRTAVNIQQLSNHPVDVYGGGKMFDVWCGKVLNDDLWEDEAIGKIIYRTDAPDEVYGIEIQEDGMYIITTSLWGIVTQGQYEYTICIAGSQNKNVAPSWVFYGPTSIFNAINSSPDSATVVYCVQLFKGNVIHLSGISYTPLESGIGSDDFYGKLEVVRMASVTSNVTTFTPPTASEPGKAGLVPQPQATDPSVQINNILTMQGWKKISSAAMIPDKKSGKLIQGMDSLLDPVDLNDIYSGNYYLGNITANAPNNEKTCNLLAWRTEVGTTFQMFITQSGIHVRGSTTDTGQFVWNPWTVIGAPRPKSAAGVGQVQAVENSANFVNLPDGGVWFYHLWGHLIYDRGTLINGQALGIAGGGTPIYVIPSNGQTPDIVSGWAWCIA